MAVSMRSIAREVGVSATVVSKLFRGDPDLCISEARRQEIFAARDRLGGVKVRPSRLSHTIVSPIPQNFPDAYIRKNVLEIPVYSAFKQALEEQGFRWRQETIANADICRRLKGWIASKGRDRPDGILMDSDYCTEESAMLLRTYAFPHVSSDFTREHLEINTVCHHATAGMRKLVEHLVGLGHRRLAFMGQDDFYRYPMLISAMTAMNLPVHPKANTWLGRIDYPDDQADIRRRAAEAFDGWRAKNPNVTALVCSNDHCALGVIDAMRRRGLVPGRDLSMVGYDDIESHDPILTTIHNPAERIGRRMAELLLNQIMYGQTAIIHERVPVSLVVRETTGPVISTKERLS